MKGLLPYWSAASKNVMPLSSAWRTRRVKAGCPNRV